MLMVQGEGLRDGHCAVKNNVLILVRLKGNYQWWVMISDHKENNVNMACKKCAGLRIKNLQNER